MKKWLLGCGVAGAIVGGLLLATVIGLLVYGVGIVNREVSLRNEAAAQGKANEVVFDTVWKIIAQQADVNDSYKEDFRKSWAEIVAAQNSGAREGSLKVFVNRFNPKFDSDLSKKLMNTIEGQREKFATNQKKLIDIKNQHDNLRKQTPQKWIVSAFGDPSELEIKIVTSQRTSDTFESGKDDDISLRPGQKKEPPKEEPKKEDKK